MKITVAEMKELMDKMAQTGLKKFSVQEEGFRLTLCAGKAAVSESVVLKDAVVSAESQPAEFEPGTVGDRQEVSSGNVMEAPIVGTFYGAPAPDKAPFVAVGSKVKKGDVLFIIESMKLMNEIQSEFDGEVAEILLKDGSPVEFGQPVMIIR